MEQRNLKLLIVDDEPEIREGLSQVIPWEENGITLAGMAGNGSEALEMIRVLCPDIVLLDIRMPVMNGLEVLEHLAELAAMPKVIIVSGYDDFEYCRRALRTGVIDYLLKPCRPQTVLEAVMKVRSKVLTEEEQNQQWDHLRKQFHENIEILREKFLIYLIRHDTIDLETSLSRWQVYEMGLTPRNLGLVLIRIEPPVRGPEVPAAESQSPPASIAEGLLLEELETLRLSIRENISACLRQAPVFQHYIADYNDDLLILWNVAEEPVAEFIRRMEGLRQTIVERFSRRVTVGLGEPAADLSRLSAAFNSALLAVEHGFWEGTDRILGYPREENWTAMDSSAILKEQNAIVQCIRTNDAGQLLPSVEAFFTKLMQQGSKGYVQKMVIALMCSIYHTCVERGIITERIFGPNLAILDELPHLKTPEELRQKIYTCVNRIIEEQPSHTHQWKVVNQAMKFMEEHYAEAINLESVAQSVYVSTGYLSAIFKKVARQNFVDCLHEVRVGKARELLRGDRMKVYEVALLVGYKDEKYFSQIFKKITGMTPNQYRETAK